MKRILGHGSRGLGNTDEEKVKSVSVTDANAKRNLIKYSLLLVASRVSEAAMCNDNSTCCHVSPDPAKFFPYIKGNLTKIVWAHAVNSLAELDKALLSGRSIAIRSLSFLRLLHSRDGEKNDDILIILACYIADIVVSVEIALKVLNVVF